MKKSALWRLTPVHVVIDLGTVIAIHRRCGIIKRCQQIRLDIVDLCNILVDTVKNILHMAGIDL